jgi:hypothetical protein
MADGFSVCHLLKFICSPALGRGQGVGIFKPSQGIN